MTKMSIRREDIAVDFKGIPDVAGVLHLLWDKSRDSLTDGELAGIAATTSTVADTLDQLSTMLAEISCVEPGSVADMSKAFYPLSEWLGVQAAMLHVADHATAALLRPGVYRKGQP